VIDLQPLFFALTMDTSTEFLFGKSADVLIEGETSEQGDKFSEAYDYATEVTGMHARLGKIIALIPNKKYKDSIQFIHQYVGSYVDEAFESGKAKLKPEDDGGQDSQEEPKYVFLHELAKSGVDKKKIRDELLNVLFAGRDTTASLLAYTFYILARRPDVFQKLRTEVMTLEFERPNFEQIKSMKYLHYTLNEGKASCPRNISEKL
jgi:cytochrome P450